MTYILTFIGGAVYMLGAILLGQWLKTRQPQPGNPEQTADEAQCREWGIRP